MFLRGAIDEYDKSSCYVGRCKDFSLNRTFYFLVELTLRECGLSSSLTVL